MSNQKPASRAVATTENGDRLVARYGELMDSRALTALFKFGSDRSFRRSAAKGTLPVSVFHMPGRRGWFARTRDVAMWLAAPGRDASKVPPPVNGRSSQNREADQTVKRLPSRMRFGS